ncbi:Arginine--pyruvate transaminase AruH [Candidatus Izimaplasma bacterium HR1]|uniref:pyridoxal phosphate-dependent aminotransferase n=1 Tax=Candidatus Izimoplasma sp. HR1 TaxID=1541959 RepID=UPI0004F893EC|nr:Arginine--pyruvate transaminase AruH [Candidatus Izimaplasma bacterium HR1]
MKISNRVLEMQESPVRKLVPIATRVKKQGKKVYHLNIGQPDIKTPEVFMDAINKYDTSVIKYSFSQGEPILIDAIRNFFKRDGIIFNENNVLITNGGSEAITFSTIAMCDPGDEILIPEPFYTNYNGFTGEVNVNLVPITTLAKDGFHLPKKEDIVKLITPKTKAILFSNPGNPTGTILRRDEMEILAEIAIENDLYIISDEVYRGMAFDGLEALSMGCIEGIDDRLVIIESVSKRYSACGARIGAICSHNEDLIKNILKLCQARLCVATLEQIGAAALYSLPTEYTEGIKNEYQARRDIVFETLSNIDGVVCEKPTGAFYVVVKLPVDDAEKFIIWMLEEFTLDNETIMLSPAEGFYGTEGLGKDEARIAYVLNTEDMKRAMLILEKGLEAYNQK